MAIQDYIHRVLNAEHPAQDSVVKVEELTSTFAYIGIAPGGSLTSEANWRIARIYRQGNLYTIEYANGGGTTQIWDNRASLFAGVSLNNSYSLQFDGVNDYVDFGNNYGFEVSQAFSISFWCKPDNLSATRCLISKCSNDANVWGYNIQHLVTTGKIQLQMRTPASAPLYAFTTSLVAGVWQHIVVTFSGNSNINGARCYCNAVIGDTPGSSSLAGSMVNLSSFVVGARNTSFPYSGMIDEVSVWNKELSQSEVTEIYNSGTPGSLTSHSAVANLQSWWRFGDNDTFPTILDNKGSINGTMTNMIAGSIVADVP